MKIMTKNSIEVQAHCPINSFENSYPICPATFKKDNLTFGMSVNHQSGCCVEKIKTGRTDGCCAHIPNEKFVEHYRASVTKETEATGIKPQLDPEVQVILDSKQVHKALPSTMNSKSADTAKPQPAKPSASKLKTIFTTPVRFFKWLFIGFWKDIRLILTGQKDR